MEEKPSAVIFEEAFQQAVFEQPGLRKSEVLHIGDSLAGDYCGAKVIVACLHCSRDCRSLFVTMSMK